MPRVIRDIKCEHGHIEYDTLSDPDRSPLCSSVSPDGARCGAATTTHFASRSEGITERRADNFSPIKFGGVVYETASDWNRCRAEWKQNHREELNVTGTSRRERLSELEQANHNALALSRRRGNVRDANMIERAGGRIR